MLSYIQYLNQTLYYFIKLPFFSLKLSKRYFQTIEDAYKICPKGPKTEFYYAAIIKASDLYPFLRGQEPQRLSALYNLVSAVREADVYLYPFLNKRNVTSFNVFSGLDILKEYYDNGPVLVLYAHTGSFYQVIAATAVLGYKVYPIAYGMDISTMEKPFRWLFNLNMKLSERHFSGGHYLYANTPTFVQSLRKILSTSEKSVIYAAIDLPQSFITGKRLKINFLGREAAFPYKIIEVFTKRRLPILIAFPFIDVMDNKLKRIVTYEKVPDILSTSETMQLYASRLEDFAHKKPEQLINLINLEGFFV